MPRVKIDYVVSFSSEDQEYPASNLLASEISKKKWLCKKGEQSCSVVLQLAKSVQISDVHVGAHQAALVEILVGRSEKPSDPFEVLVPTCTFLTPAESRRENACDRVRSFNAEHLTTARHSRWDRVRIHCSQPYNKHSQFGISFIHIFEPEGCTSIPSARPATATSLNLLDTLDKSEDEDSFKPGELFAKARASTGGMDSVPNTNELVATNSNTDSQIRKTSLQAFRNISDSSIKVIKSPVLKNHSNQAVSDDEKRERDRQRECLIYTEDDDKPHDKIDRVLHRHKVENARKEQNQNNAAKMGTQTKDNNNRKDESRFKDNKERSKEVAILNPRQRTEKPGNSPRRKGNNNELCSTSKAIKSEEEKKRSSDLKDHHNRSDRQKTQERAIRKERTDKEDSKLVAGPISSSPHTLMSGVKFCISGYTNPRRASLRSSALAMGAVYNADCTPHTTHLICAFPNTPKLREFERACQAAGRECVAVQGEWVEQCCESRRLLPWSWFATRPERRVSIPPGALQHDTVVTPTHSEERSMEAPSPTPDGDTDDEIQRVLEQQRERSRKRSRRSRDRSRSNDAVGGKRRGDVSFEHSQGEEEVPAEEYSDETEVEYDAVGDPEQIELGASLPAFFEGYTFSIEPDVESVGFERMLLARYITAYGGLLVEPCEGTEVSCADFVLSVSGTGSQKSVRPDWIWACAAARTLLPPSATT